MSTSPGPRRKVLTAYRSGPGSFSNYYSCALECGHTVTAYGRKGASPAAVSCHLCARGEPPPPPAKGPQRVQTGPRRRAPQAEAPEPSLEPRQPSRVLLWPFPWSVTAERGLVRNVPPPGKLGENPKPDPKRSTRD